MKKLLPLLFLIPVFASAQKTTGPNYTYVAQRYEWLAGVFKALGLPAGDSAQFQTGQEQRAGAVYYDSTGANAGLYVYNGSTWDLAGSGLPYLNSTGLLANGLLTINGGDNTKFDLAAGTGEIVDYATDPVIPTKTSVSWSAFTAQTVTNIASADKTYVMINNAGAITQQTTFPTAQERRQKIFVGTIVHPNHSTIQNARTVPDFVQGPASQMYDFFDALGAFSVDGNRISPNGVNLSFNKTAGHIFRRGANYQSDDQNPHVATLAAGTPQSFIKSTVNAQVGGTVTVVDPANYDVGGTVTAIPGGVNNSTIQRVYAFSSGLVFVQYGQTVYSSLAAAVEGIKNEAFTINPSIADGGVLLAYIVLTKGCTDLSNPAQASVLPAPRFDAGVGGGSSAVTSLQQAYNNSVTPQITTTTALGSVDIKRGSAADADNVFRIMNGAGSTTASIAGNGTSVLNTKLTITGATETVSNPPLAITQTWNNAGTTFVGIDLNVTNTGSSSTSRLMALRLAGTQVFSVNTNGALNIINGSKTGPSVNFASSMGMYSGTGHISIASANTNAYLFGASTGLSTKAANYYAWASGTEGDGTVDTRLHRISAGEIGVGTTANNTSGTMKMAALSLAEGAAPSTPASGFAVVYTKTDGLIYSKDDAGAERKLSNSTLTKSAAIELPTASENKFMFFTPVAITVTNTRAVLVGSSTPSVTYNIAFGTDRTTGTNVYTAGQTVTSTTTGTDASGVNDDTIPANSWVWITTSAQSGTVTELDITLTYTED